MKHFDKNRGEPQEQAPKGEQSGKHIALSALLLAAILLLLSAIGGLNAGVGVFGLF